jgi:hypothetical protein
MNKKAELGLIVTILVLAIAIVSLVVSNNFNRECNKNSDCSDNSYCGSDYACHEYPKEVQVKQNTFLPAAIVLGLALIVAAYIFRGGKFSGFKKN